MISGHAEIFFFIIFIEMLAEAEISKIIALDFVRIEFYEPDLVMYHYKPKIHLTWGMVQQVAAQTNEMINYRKCYMCSIIGDGLTVEKEVREKGTTPEMQAYTIAAAIVQNSLAHRIIANFIIRVQRPPVATRAFNNKEDALAWFDKLRLQKS